MNGFKTSRCAAAFALVLVVVAVPCAAIGQTGVSEDRVSLPEGPGSIEGIGENASIDPNMGLMSYSVPFDLPEGYDDLAVSLGLSYNSGSGNSVVGMGWAFSVGSVERSTLRGLPHYDENDAFAAGGSSQLVKTPGTDPPVYRARFEGGFTRYAWMGSDGGDEGYWVAEHSDGLRSYFGADSGGEIQPASRDSGPSGTFRYHLVETVDRFGHAIRYTYEKDGNLALLTHVGWVFAGGKPTYEVTVEYEARQDKLSDGKPGFELLLQKRLKTVKVISRGTEIRRYEMAYQGYSESGGFSRLESVTLFGLNGAQYPARPSFEYSRALGVDCALGDDCELPYVVSMGSLGVDLKKGTATLIDINGDSLPDVIDTSLAGKPHRFFHNILSADGTHVFGPAVESLVGNQGSHDLKSPYVQVLDVDGDGFTDMLNAQTGQVLVNAGGGDWVGAMSMWTEGGGGTPDLGNDFDPSDGQLRTVRFMDYNNDKRIDIVRSEFSGDENETFIFENTGTGSFVLDPDVAPLGAGFESDTLELNDMNGDGLLDPVIVTKDQVRYRLNLGLGQWSDWIAIDGFNFSDQEAVDANMEDLNGDGLADLTLVTGNAVRYWVNRNGASFDPERTVTSDDVDGDIPEKVSDVTTVLYADMNGNGSNDVVWIDGSGKLTYLELFPVRPNLLWRIKNGLGRVTAVTYVTSVSERARDEEDAPWLHPLPYPMTVVKQEDRWEEVSKVHEVTEYTYHDGYFDGVEKRFQGYGRVESVEPGDDFSEDSRLLLEYDLGVTDTYHAGLPLREEQQSGGRSLGVISHEYEECPVAGVPDSGLSFAVRFVCQSATETEVREGKGADAWVTLRTESKHDGYGRVIWGADLGVVSIGGGDCGACSSGAASGTPCGPDCSGDEEYQSSEYATPDENGDTWILDLAVRQRGYSKAKQDGQPADEQFTERVTYYDGEAFAGLGFGKFTQGLITRSTERANTDGDVVEVVRNRFDEHGNVIEQLDALAAESGQTHRALWTYDEDGLFLVRAEVGLEDKDGHYRLRREVAYDPVFDQALKSTPLMVVRDGVEPALPIHTYYEYDEFGRIVSIFSPGDDAGKPGQVFEYDVKSPASRVVVKDRSKAGGLLDREVVQCVDGMGRVFEERTRLSESKWLVSGHSVFNGQGAEYRSYRRHTESSGACGQDPGADVPSMQTWYDGTGRVVRKTWPEVEGDGGVPESRTEYVPLGSVEWDMEDTREGGPHYATPTTTRMNGAGQVLTIERLLSTGTPLVHSLGYDELGNISAVVDPAGNKRVQEWDLRGRLVRVDDPDRGETRFEYDDNGNMIAETDATGQVTVYEYDGANRLRAYWKEGEESETRVEYIWDTDGDCPADICTNTAGVIASVSYPLEAGSRGEDRLGYDVRGDVVYAGRRIGGRWLEMQTELDGSGHPVANTFPSGLRIDWTIDDAGRTTSVPGYIDSLSYDEFGRIDVIKMANGVVSAWAFDQRERVRQQTVTGPQGTKYVDREYAWDRADNLLKIDDHAAVDGIPSGSGVFDVDALYRLTKARLDPGRPGIEETLTTVFDSSDNVVSQESSIGQESAANVGEYTYGDGAGPHAVTGAGDVTFEYDAAGRLTARGAVSFEWDHQGRMTRAIKNDNDVLRLAYGHTGERLLKREGAHFSYYVTPDFEVRDGAAVTYVRFEGDRLVEITEHDFAAKILSDVAPALEEDGTLVSEPDGRITAADAWLAQAAKSGDVAFKDLVEISSVQDLLAAGADRALADDPSMPQVRYLHTDERGDTTAITDEDGLLVGQALYYPHGLSRHTSGEAAGYGFAGKEEDGTGLVAMGSRLYDPWTGRFVSPDPAFNQIDADVGANLAEATGAYSYCGGNPQNCRDEDGRIVLNIVGGIVGAVVGAVGEIAVQATRYKLGMVKPGWRGVMGSVGMVFLRAGVGLGFGLLSGGLSAIADGMNAGRNVHALNVAKKDPSMSHKTMEGYGRSNGSREEMRANIVIAGYRAITGDFAGAVGSLGTAGFNYLDSKWSAKHEGQSLPAGIISTVWSGVKVGISALGTAGKAIGHWAKHTAGPKIKSGWKALGRHAATARDAVSRKAKAGWSKVSTWGRNAKWWARYDGAFRNPFKSPPHNDYRPRAFKAGTYRTVRVGHR